MYTHTSMMNATEHLLANLFWLHILSTEKCKKSPEQKKNSTFICDNRIDNDFFPNSFINYGTINLK